MSRRLSIAPLAVLGALAASVALAACGASGSPTDAAASSEQQSEQRFLAFAKCLREHGIAVSTPTAGGSVRISGQSASPRQFEAATKACKRYAPAERAKVSPQERVAQEESVQKFAKCMREHGVKLEVHTAAGGGAVKIGIHAGRVPGQPNPESPSFQAAQKACQALFPKGPKGGPGPRTNSSGGPAGGGPKAGFQVGG